MLAITEAYRAGLLKTKNWYPNIIAGIVVGIVALPLAMAFAIASGVKPEQGIYTAIIAAIFVAVFGGSRVQIAGPTAAFIVILANITAKYGIGGLQIATFMAGFILIFMGITKLGSIIKFIPEPVIVGFTTGIAISIFVGQWQNFFTLSVAMPLDAPFLQKIYLLAQALPHLSWLTTGLGCLTILFVILTPRFVKHIPGSLVAMAIVTACVSLFHLSNIPTLASAFGGIPQKLPTFQLPSFSMSDMLQLVGPAFTIALLGAIESLLSAAVADGMANTRHNSNQELIGQGLANLVAPLFGGIAATGAIARTATNIRSGGNSPLAAIIHSLVLIAFILLLAPLLSHVPLCVLSGILFVIAYNIADFPHFFRMVRRAPYYDVIVLLATFALTVFTNIVIAVNIGVILALLFFVRRMYQSVIIEQQHADMIQHEMPLTAEQLTALNENLIVYSIQGPFFFGVAEKLEHALAITHTEPKSIVFRFKEVPFMDITGIETFYEIVDNFKKRNVRVYLCEANKRVKRKLENNHIQALTRCMRFWRPT